MTAAVVETPVSAEGRRAGTPDSRPNVVIYTHSLLGGSMTFIRSHAAALRQFQPVYAGSHRVPGLDLPPGRSFTANCGGMTGWMEELLFRQFGITGRFGAALRRLHPRLVHAHFGQSGPAALALAESLGVPLIVTYHGQDATIADAELRRSWRGREYLRGRASVVARASLVIAVSDFIRSRLLAAGFPPAKVVTHRNGIDISYFDGAAGRREPIVLFVGRFVEKKGCEFLLRALGLLSRRGVRAKGVLIGEGVLGPSLRQLAAEVGADVSFTGFLPLDDVKQWLGRAAVVAVPSVTAADGNSEGLPTVILEAQSMGTPVVATRHAGNAEGVVEGESALLVDERDVDGLASALRFFLESPRLAADFGAAGRRFVKSHFSIETQVAGLEQLYMGVASSPR